jgi:maltose O-acetyltransferase
MRLADVSTEREKMLAGEDYNARDAELLAIARRARVLVSELNAIPAAPPEVRHALLEQLLGAAGAGAWVESPFYCDYGENIYLGKHTFINMNCVFLDSGEIRIGENGLIGPNVQLYTVSHPLRAADRLVAGWTPATGRSIYRTSAAPIQIGSGVWIGGGTIVMPGVTIGDHVTIGAGSIVTQDIPSNVLAFGQPCRVRQEL